MNKSSKRLLSVLILLSVALFTACTGEGDAEPTPTPIPREAAPIAPTYEVQQGDIIASIDFTGRVVPVKQESLYFRTDGRVRDLNVAVGDSVTTGDVLADLHVVGEIEQERSLINLQLRRAEINLEIAKLHQKLAEASTDANAAIDVAIKELEVELAQLDLDEMQLDARDWDSAIRDAQIIAPFDGEILSIDLEPGGEARAFRNVMVLADTGELEIQAELLSNVLILLEEGLQAQVGHYNEPGDMVSAMISSLPFITDNSNRIVHITLETPLQEAGFELRDRVQVDITLEERRDVLWLPPQAIREFAGRQFVVVRDGDTEQRVDVELGLRGADRVEIVSGLELGQIVVGQ